MRFRWAVRALVLVVLGLLSSGAEVVGAGRKNIRDFPANTVCPVNRGWFVDNTGAIVPPPEGVARAPEHTFVATGPVAKISLLACDRGFEVGNPDELRVLIRSVGVIRKDVYTSHQKAATFYNDAADCNREHLGEELGTRRVGSVFDANVVPRVLAGTAGFPFFDDFSNLAKSNLQWNLDAAVFSTLVPPTDPRFPALASARMLELARAPVDPDSNSCSQATVWVSKLQANQEYVIDLFWRNDFNFAGQVQLITQVDVNPIR